jgi:hypothetical protein
METQDFQQTATHGPIVKWEQLVQTPMPEHPDGSGYTKQENRHVVYEIGAHYVEVKKVSNRGWTVSRYDEDGLDWMEGGVYYEDEAAAHEKAEELIKEVA